MSSTKVNGWILLVMGLLFIAFGGYLMNVTSVNCDGEPMTAGDTCTSIVAGKPVSITNEALLKERKAQGYIATGAGALFVVIAGVVVLVGKRRRRFEDRADTAATSWNRAA